MAAERLKSNNLETQRGVLADIGSNLILKDRKLSLDIEKPLLAIKQAAETAKEINKRLEPAESLYATTSFEEIYAQFPVMGPVHDTIITILSDTAYMQNLWNSFTFLMEMQKNESLANM